MEIHSTDRTRQFSNIDNKVRRERTAESEKESERIVPGDSVSIGNIARDDKKELRTRSEKAPCEKTRKALQSYKSESVPLTILHTNDIHGHMEPFVEGKKLVGGLAYLAEIIEEERSVDKAHTLVLDAGDSVQGSPLSDFYLGKPIRESMNKIGYSATVLGNHDFDNGLAVLADRLAKSKSPALAANLKILKEGSNLEGKTVPYIIKDFDGVKVGIIGLVTPDAVQMIKRQDECHMIAVTEPEEALRHELPRMKKDGVDVVIVLSHLGIQKDREIAEQFDGIDVIVGGHTHTKLQKPLTIADTIIMQAGCNGKYVGDAHLSIDRETKKVSLRKYELISVEKKRIEPDPEVSKIVRKYEDKLRPILREELTELKTNLTQRDCHIYREESNIGNAITDLLRENTGADIGFLTAASMRSNLYKGTLRAGDVYTMFPWPDQLMTLSLTGTQIKQMLEQGMSKMMNGIAFSGLNVVVDTTQPEGRQVVSVTRENGEPLMSGKHYTVATRDYLGDGTTGMSVMLKGKDKKKYGDFRKHMIKWFKNADKITTKKDGRLKNIGPAD